MLQVACGEWMGHAWRHRAVLVGESRLPSETGLLYLTGGDPHPGDIEWAEAVSARSGLPVVACFDVPNQPIFGLVEDELIAFTFQRFLETGDPRWPLLHPMVEGALEVARVAGEMWGLSSWIPIGASKRGWTAWLTAIELAERAKGAVPMAFDHLVMDRQLARQVSLWGSPSPMYEPYSELGLTESTHTPEGQALLGLVDPYRRLDRLCCPVHLVSGANDPYWLVDASEEYWSEIPVPSSALFLANTAHVLPSSPSAVGSIARFAAACAGGRDQARVEVCEGQGAVSGLEVAHAWLWTAESESHRFDGSLWRPAEVTDLSTLPSPEGKDGCLAMYLEVYGRDDSGPFSVSSRPQVFTGGTPSRR